jgi:putative DNA primase/helicase
VTDQPKERTLESARFLVRQRGFSVIPLDHPDETQFPGDPTKCGKMPCFSWKTFQSIRPTDDNLTAWFGNGHRRNMAIVTGAISRVVVVDGDSPEALAWMHTHLPATPMRTKTAKGEHWFYRHPGTPVRNKARINTGDGKIALDVRGDGGYVVAPTSKHATGVLYERLGNWPRVEDLPVLEAQLLEEAQPTASSPAAAPRQVRDGRERLLERARAYLRHTPGAIQGQGGDTHTFQVACRIVRGFQLDQSDARLVLEEWNAKCVPPWSDRALEAKIATALKNGRESFGARAAEPPPGGPPTTLWDLPGGGDGEEPRTVFPLTDTGNAEAFAAWCGDRVRYDYQRKKFYIWRGHRFELDADGDVERLARDVVRRRGQLAAAIENQEARDKVHKWALASESSGRLDAMLKLVRSMRPIAVTGEQWDRDPWLLGVPNGVIDLRTGELRAGTQDDGVTLCAGVPFDPAAECPTWERVVLDVFNDDRDLTTHLHKAFGYSLTGITTEQCLWVLHGTGANGKSTIVNAIRAVLGEYGHVMPFGTMLGTGQRVDLTNDIAALNGRRLVVASEANEGARFDEARLKQLTGGDTVTARYLYGEFFEFEPVAKFFLSTNHRPAVRDQTHSFWRRLRLVPFTRTFPTNAGLWEELLAEAPGILAWAVRGCLLWQAEGLGTPVAMTEATDAYQQDTDPLTDFIAEACALDPEAEVMGSDLYAGYVRWADMRRLSERERLSQTAFGRKASERWKKTRLTAGVVYAGLKLSGFF